MTKDEIVTALRCCSDIRAKCNDCILCKRVECTYELKVDAADLIENQQWEIEALRQANRRIRETHYHESAVQAMQGQRKWIPVMERLPEEGIPVLVNYIGNDDGKMHPDGVAVWTDACCLWWEGSLKDCDTEVTVPITHWMLLPEAPEVE